MDMITAKSIGTGGLGRMGNQMFTIAGCMGIAVKSGQPYAFPEWKTHDNALFGQPVDNISDHLLNPLPLVPDQLTFNDYGYFWGYRDINLPTGNWSIDAHLQSEKFFSHCMPLIRETFTFKDEPEQNDFVAIHYRAGDYIDDPNAYHPRCSREYYLDAMIEMADHRQNKFILFSDDKDAFYKTINFRYHHYFYHENDANGSYIEDFKLMKKCKSFICANSSFSLMAAILGDHPEKKIICPRNWFGSQAGDIDTRDIYPQNAIVI